YAASEAVLSQRTSTPPYSNLFPYTTLFRSDRLGLAMQAQVAAHLPLSCSRWLNRSRAKHDAGESLHIEHIGAEHALLNFGALVGCKLGVKHFQFARLDLQF